jgi:photoactive yellow protein
MHDTSPIAFDAPLLAATLSQMSDAELDALPYGVIEMDLAGVTTRYNATESRYAGLPAERVLGRHFFRDVAPCANNRHVAGRYEQGVLDETLAYTFSLRMKAVPVTLRLLRTDGGERMFMVVWRTSTPA